MGRFNNNNNGTPMDYSSSDNNNFDILKRVNEHLSDNEEEEKIKTKSFETDNSSNQYKEEKENIENGTDRSLREKGKNKNIGASLLSPLNKNKIKQEDNNNYISPFSDEFANRKEIMQNEEDDYSEEEQLVSGNRIQFYAIFGFILYILALGLGYHFTSFSNGIPQITSMEQRAVVDYVGQVDSYIASLQDIHSESINYIENYTNGVVGATELETSIKNSDENINKKQSELKDVIPPSQYENFQSQLTELYSLQAALNSATANYGKSKTIETFNIVKEANDKYESTMESFLLKYNELYSKKQ